MLTGAFAFVSLASAVFMTGVFDVTRSILSLRVVSVAVLARCEACRRWQAHEIRCNLLCVGSLLLGVPMSAAGRKGSDMVVLGIAVLKIRGGEETRFEKAFGKAEHILEAAKGYIGHELRRCLEARREYLLLMWWQEPEDHTAAFQASAAYQEWKALLQHFCDPFPSVQHYVPVDL